MRKKDRIVGYKEVTFEKDSVFLVTGGAGFIGSNIVEALLKKAIKFEYLMICLKENKKMWICF